MSGHELELRYHVPRSQVWEGSCGRQQGKVHLHVLDAREFTASNGRKIVRGSGAALCGKVGWYETPEILSHHDRCPRCVDLAERYGVTWPESEAVSA